MDPDGRNWWDFTKGLAQGAIVDTLTGPVILAAKLATDAPGVGRAVVENLRLTLYGLRNPSELADQVGRMIAEGGSSHQELGRIVGASAVVVAGGAAGGLRSSAKASAGEAAAEYSARVWTRAAEAGDLYHNFPIALDSMVMQGRRVVSSNGYIQYTVAGSINGRRGVFEIGATMIDGREVINHRFFRPDPQ